MSSGFFRYRNKLLTFALGNACHFYENVFIVLSEVQLPYNFAELAFVSFYCCSCVDRDIFSKFKCNHKLYFYSGNETAQVYVSFGLDKNLNEPFVLGENFIQSPTSCGLIEN